VHATHVDTYHSILPVVIIGVACAQHGFAMCSDVHGLVQ
jgi:hypothetical protein